MRAVSAGEEKEDYGGKDLQKRKVEKEGLSLEWKSDYKITMQIYGLYTAVENRLQTLNVCDSSSLWQTHRALNAAQ